MPTYTALTTLDSRAAAEGLGEAMERLDPAPTGVGVFELEDGSGLWEVGGYFTEAPDTAGLAVLEAAFGARPFTVSELPETDWVAKVRRELHPVQAGRFFVHGAHDADKVPDGSVPLLIEASMAFGTGHHGTTEGCLRALHRLAESRAVPRKVADIGCGTAVLAMAAAKLWPAVVLASDIDPVAVQVAEANIAANGLTDRIRCVEAVGLDHPDLGTGAKFDLICANILKGPLIALSQDITERLAPGGTAILSGLLAEQADEVVSVYCRNGVSLGTREDIVGWTTLNLVQHF